LDHQSTARGASKDRQGITALETPPSLSRDEIVEFATYIYGWTWRNCLAEALDMDRGDLVRLLAADGRISHELSSKVIHLLALRLAEVDAERDSLGECVRQFNLRAHEAKCAVLPRQSRRRVAS